MASQNMYVVSTNFAKTLVANLDMTLYCDVTNSVCRITMTIISHCSVLEFDPIKQSPRASPDLCTPLGWCYHVGLFPYC